jgi:flagellar biosynthesis/type III secretory pathway chaperone
VHQPLHHLATVLDKLLAEHERLLRLSQRQKQVLVARRMEEIQRVTAEMQASITRVHELEASRQEITEALAESWGLSPDTLTLTTIEDRVRRTDPRLAGRLAQTGRRLRDTLSLLAQQNRENERLTEQWTQYTTQMFEWVARHAGTAGYHPAQSPDGTPRNLVFDLKA